MEQPDGGNAPENLSHTLDFLSSCFPHNPAKRSETLDPQLSHRLNLCAAWGIQPGNSLRIFDVGCGQGESSLVLAHLVDHDGHVTGIDPAPETYGAPYNLGKAHSFIGNSPLGSRIDFIQSTARAYLTDHLPDLRREGSPERPFDAAVFCHSLWYFQTRDEIAQQFVAIATAGIPRLCLAEYTCRAGSPGQVPHELAARAQILFHSMRRPQVVAKDDDLNVRGALEPEAILSIATGAGWRLGKSGVINAPANMKEGFWEADVVLSERFQEHVRAEGLRQEDENEILSYAPKIESSIEMLEKKGEKVATMDVFWAVMELVVKEE